MGLSRVGGTSCDVPAQETPRETGEAAVRETGDAGRETGLVGRAWLGPAAAAVLATGTGLTGRSALGRAKSGMAGHRAAAATGTGGVGRTPGAAWLGPTDGVSDGGDETKGCVDGRGGDGTAGIGGVVRIGGSSSVDGASSSMQAVEGGGETAAQLSKQSPAAAVVPPAIHTVPVSCSGERLRRRIADGRIPRCDLCASPLRLDLLLPGEACRTDEPPPGDTALLSPEDAFTAMHKADVEVNVCVRGGGACTLMRRGRAMQGKRCTQSLIFEILVFHYLMCCVMSTPSSFSSSSLRSSRPTFLPILSPSRYAICSSFLGRICRWLTM